MTGSRTRRTVTVLPAADKDLDRLEADDPRLSLRARAIVQLLEEGRLDGQPLRNLPSYGDMSDCRKVYFAATAVRPTHRLVYRVSNQGSRRRVEVLEVVAIESRDDGYVYLLAASRLGVLPPETRPRFQRVHQEHIAEPSQRRKTPPTTGR